VAGQPLAALLSAMAVKGTVIVYGMLAGHSFDMSLAPMMSHNLTLRGFAADLLVKDPETKPKVVGYIEQGLASGALKPEVDCTFPLEQAAQAHAYLESNVQLGKIVLTTSTAGE
jgi:NADPH:quinone reductase-like Zn-dependent oxidoreductase